MTLVHIPTFRYQESAHGVLSERPRLGPAARRFLGWVCPAVGFVFLAGATGIALGLGFVVQRTKSLRWTGPAGAALPTTT